MYELVSGVVISITIILPTQQSRRARQRNSGRSEWAGNRRSVPGKKKKTEKEKEQRSGDVKAEG